jgi:hypothetical protein
MLHTVWQSRLRSPSASLAVAPLLAAAPSFARVLTAVAIAAWLALLVFWHAYRKGNRNAKAWAVFTFLAPVAALPLYVVRRWIGKVRQRR